jgi:hypothetical protein
MEIPLLFGRYLVRRGKISEEQLLETTKVQAEINRSFAVAALENEFITLDDFKKAIAYQRQEGIRFREALLQLEIADEETIKRIHNASDAKSVKLGALLVKKGLMEENDLQATLDEFKAKGALELL